MSRYSRWGYFTNRRRIGQSIPTPAPVVNVSESSNQTAVVYTITTNVTSEPNIYYSLTGNIATTDFDDASINGNITLGADGNATLIKTITSNVNIGENKDFAIQITTNEESNSIIYAGNTYTFTSEVPFSATGGTTTTYDDGGTTYKVHNLSGDINYFPSQTARVALTNLDEFLGLGFVGAPQNGTETFTVTDLGNDANANIQVLMVGAGGMGGNGHTAAGGGGGGGGANEIIPFTASDFSIQDYTATTGYGGWTYTNVSGSNITIVDTPSGNVTLTPGSTHTENATSTYFRSNVLLHGSPGLDATPPFAGSIFPSLYTAGNGGNGGVGDVADNDGAGGGGGGTNSAYSGNAGGAGSGGTGATAGSDSGGGDGGNSNITISNWFSTNTTYPYAETFETGSFTLGNGGYGAASAGSGVNGSAADPSWGRGANGRNTSLNDFGFRGTVQVKYITFEPYRFLA